jgi:hypothetical protein
MGAKIYPVTLPQKVQRPTISPKKQGAKTGCRDRVQRQGAKICPIPLTVNCGRSSYRHRERTTLLDLPLLFDHARATRVEFTLVARAFIFAKSL